MAAAYFLAWPLWRARFLIEIWPTEGWNSYLQDAAAAGLPIYPPAGSLVGNNYPPLSFYAIGFIGKAFGVDNLFAGRVVSFVALVAVAIEIFLAVRILVGGRAGAAIGALWYLAIMARNSTIYVGTNDPQLGGEAIMGAALVWFLSRYRAGRSPTPSLLLMVAAGFWKHNIIAIPVTAISWVFITRSRYAVRPAIISAAACMIGIACCVFIFGSDFLPNLLANRQYALSHVIGNIGHLQWSGLALFIWAGWAFSARKSEAARFTAFHIGSSLFACILQWFGHGVSRNAEFDLILALGIGLGVVFTRIEAAWLAKRIGAGWCRDLMIAVLLLRLVASDRQETALLMLSSDFRSSLYTRQQNILTDAARVAAMPGDVACDIKIMCRLAKKPFVVDEFKIEELIATGNATTAEVASMLRARQITPFAHTPLPNDDVSFLRWWRDH
ncbi:MAG TPA: hypothetical protein VGZ92_08590 [Bradyrhizobium sp.]|nr:hypothetical protein [Bradyrhizobium sp.]